MARRNQSLLDDALHGAATVLATVFRMLAMFRAGEVSLRRRESPAGAEFAALDDALQKMSGPEFQGLVAAAFRQEGYLVVGRGSGGAERGVDLEMYLGRDRYLVHCRQWRAARIGVGELRELFAVMRAERAVGSFIVSSGSFTDEARSFATGRAIRLVPAESLRRMIAGAGGSDEASVANDLGGDIPPACPQCGKAMISRVAGRGGSVGQSFWGCSGFPACQGVRAK